ncbi:hypothetical protein FEZ51_02125 [Pediococcus stilesii]|uniref:Uncharacterized protein n=1 Tax=Pediococcus stilesii TaxID=331679 RepID=A0A5R9BXV5_9LACO|nr:hypothetical protein [Pediococcus stilesii]TLQ05477.1 hypothetical protein FEZ51_02125 [Pediococcus stilesii]
MRNTEVYLVTDGEPLPREQRISELDNRTGYKIKPVLADVNHMGDQKQQLVFNMVADDSKIVRVFGKQKAKWVIYAKDYRPKFNETGFASKVDKKWLNKITLRRYHRNRTDFYIMGTKAED